MRQQEIFCEDIEGRDLQVLEKCGREHAMFGGWHCVLTKGHEGWCQCSPMPVHTCSDCGHSVAIILDDGIPFPMCDECRVNIHQWLEESANAHEMEYERDKYFEDKYDGMKCED